MPESVRIQVQDRIATLWLERPRALNALDASMAHGLAQGAEQLAADPAVRCVVIRGAGGNFMAGGDISVFHEWLDEPPARRREHTAQLLVPVHASIRTLRAMPKPVIACVEGACAGFGLSLMAACDLAIVANDCVFSLAYCRIGASPDGGSTFALPRLVGTKRAMGLALTGARFDAAHALAIGLVNEVIPADAVAQRATALAAELAAGPQAALARTKALINEAIDHSLEEQLALEEASFLDGVIGPEFEEGVRAFMAKRPPRFTD